MEFKDYFPVFDKLTAEEKTILENSAVLKLIKAGTVIHDGAGDCLGLLVIRSGRLRAFITSDEGREITVYRLFERDICLFSASCIMKSIQFDITISAEKDTERHEGHGVDREEEARGYVKPARLRVAHEKGLRGHIRDGEECHHERGGHGAHVQQAQPGALVLLCPRDAGVAHEQDPHER